MSDSLPVTDPPPPVVPTLPRTSPGLVNKRFSDGLQKTERVLEAANNPLYSAALAAGEISPAFLTALSADVASARVFLGAAISNRGARKGATDQESLERQTLTRLLQTVQTRSLQKFHDTDPNRPRDTYYVGTNLSRASDALLLQTATSITATAPTDALPGISGTFMANLQDALLLWQTSIATQNAQSGSAIQSLAQFEQIFASTEARRRTIQFAADADFPYYDPMQKVAREAFQLPVKTPFR